MASALHEQMSEFIKKKLSLILVASENKSSALLYESSKSFFTEKGIQVIKNITHQILIVKGLHGL